MLDVECRWLVEGQCINAETKFQMQSSSTAKRIWWKRTTKYKCKSKRITFANNIMIVRILVRSHHMDAPCPMSMDFIWFFVLFFFRFCHSECFPIQSIVFFFPFRTLLILDDCMIDHWFAIHQRWIEILDFLRSFKSHFHIFRQLFCN